MTKPKPYTTRFSAGTAERTEDGGFFFPVAEILYPGEIAELTGYKEGEDGVNYTVVIRPAPGLWMKWARARYRIARLLRLRDGT